MSTETWITLVILAIVIVAIYYIVSIWIYKRAPANMAFIRTGVLGTKVCLGRGAIVLPVFHEISWVSLETIKLIVSRSREQAVLTQDKIRIDLVTELYTHVGHQEGDILQAIRSLGEKTFDPERVRALLEAKVVSALRSFAATQTLNELHENRDAFAQEIKASVKESFQANGLTLEEVTIVTLEQTGKEFFKPDNVFDAEGLKIITEITSDARRRVHDTEKRTTVAIRQRDLDTQLELLDIEQSEAFARAVQDKAVSNEQALRLGEKQVYILEQRLAVESQEIANERELDQRRTARDISIIEEAEKRESADIQKNLAIEQTERDRKIALVAKSEEEELANIRRALANEKAERDRQIELIGKAKEQELVEIGRNLARESAEKDSDVTLIDKERERQEADIARATSVSGFEEKSRDERHKVAEQTALAIRKRSLETKLSVLDLDKEDAVAVARQEQAVSDEQAKVLSEKQRYILEQRWLVEEEEIRKALQLERAQIAKDIGVTEDLKKREAAEIRRSLAREQEERDREIALVAKGEELERREIQRTLATEQEERDRQIALVGKDEQLETSRVQMARAIELEERDRQIALIGKEQERERADIRRYLAREKEERDRQIAMAGKTRELEEAETERLRVTADREQAEHDAFSVRIVAEAEREKEIERIQAESVAGTRKIDEENKATITTMHMVSQAEARKRASVQEAEATVTRARAGSEAQQITALGIEREAGATGRAEMEIEALRVVNNQRSLEADAAGLEAKADALKKYNEAATFLELAQMHITAERDVLIDQAKAMGNALSGAQIRMYGSENGTMDTIRKMFNSGFAIGEAMEGLAHSLPQGLRERFAQNGLRGIFGKPFSNGNIKEIIGQLSGLIQQGLGSRQARQVPFEQGLVKLQETAGEDEALTGAIDLLKEVNQHGLFDDVPFDKVWALVQQAAEKSE